MLISAVRVIVDAFALVPVPFDPLTVCYLLSLLQAVAFTTRQNRILQLPAFKVELLLAFT